MSADSLCKDFIGLRKALRAMWLSVLCATWVYGNGCWAKNHAATRAAQIDQPLILSVRQANSVILSASHGDAHVIRVFPGPDGLIGAVIEGPSDVLGIAWLTSHGNAAVSGDALIDRDGTDLTKQAMYTQGLLLRPLDLLERAAEPTSNAIMVGTAGPRITVFLDPNCIYCHQLYWALEPEVAAGKVRVRYVVVGRLKTTSITRGVSLLAARNPSRALHDNEVGFDVKAEEGGYPVIVNADPALMRVLRENNALFNRGGLVGTPTVLYCAKGTGEIQMITGVPINITTLIAIANDGPAQACE